MVCMCLGFGCGLGFFATEVVSKSSTERVKGQGLKKSRTGQKHTMYMGSNVSLHYKQANQAALALHRLGGLT